MNDYVIFRRHAWADQAALERAAGRAARAANGELAGRLNWIRSYVYEETDGTLGSVCIFQATDRDVLFDHARRADLACDDVRPIARTVIIDADPAPSSRTVATETNPR
jgi:hypothetical protein